MKTATEIQSLSDSDLLEYVCSCENDEVAYTEFTNRYIKELRDICERICASRRLHSHVGLQIVTDTFEKVRKYKSYKRSKSPNIDEQKAINGFLYRIALNLFNDHYNNTKKESEPLSTYFDDLTSKVRDINDLHSIKSVTSTILKKLNEKERKVLITDIEYKRHHKYLPDYVVSELSKELNVKPATIRKVRERAISKLKKAIDEYNQE